MKTRLSERQLFERSITEDDILGACRSLLELNGARVHRIVERIPWGKRTSTPGIPDLTGWFCGPHAPLHFWIEVKKPGGRHRPAQDMWIARARADGVIAFFAESVDQMVEGFKQFGIQLKGTQ